MTRSRTLHQQFAFNRRAFLKAATTTAALCWFAPKSSATRWEASAPVSQCPIGFIDDRNRATQYANNADSVLHRIVPAERLASGDHRLRHNGVRLHFDGIQFPDESASHRLTALMVDLEMPVIDSPTGSVPWHVWTYSNRDILNVSSPVSARVPLRHDGSLAFTMTVQSAEGSTQSHTVKLTSGSESGLSKLRTGTYFVAVPDVDLGAPSTPQDIRWEELHAEAPNDSCRSPRLAEVPASHVAAPFAYLVFALENASPDRPTIA